MYTFVLTIHMIVSVLLVLIVLLQVGRGAEMGAAFGGVNQANFPQTPENVLGKITTYLAISFMVLSLTLAVMSSNQATSSLIDEEAIRQLIDTTADSNAP